MSPYFFVFFAFLFAIANRLYIKHVLYRLDGYALALASNGPGLLILLPLSWHQLPLLRHLNLTQILTILVTGALWSYVMWMGNITTARNNFSFQEIIRQTRVMWVVLGGVFIFNESLSYGDAVGILLIVSSVFIISWKQFTLREHATSRALLLTWSVTLIGATIALLEKKIVIDLPVELYSLISYLMTTFFLILFLNKKRRSLLIHTARFHSKEVVIAATLMLGTYYLGLKAYQLLPISIAYPIIQSSTVVGVLIGTIFFDKGDKLSKKIIAAIIAITGVVIVKFL